MVRSPAKAFPREKDTVVSILTAQGLRNETGHEDNSTVSYLDARFCEVCGEGEELHSRNTKYCPDCRQIVRDRQLADYSRDIWFIFERDGFQCIYCGKSSVEDRSELHADHIQPRSKGGEDVAGNLVTACVRCNLSKSNAIMEPLNMQRILSEVARRNESRDISQTRHIKLRGSA